jgi:Lrp/AsnC family transcriptional regulator, regulator for asnA, asnC and gidA
MHFDDIDINIIRSFQRDVRVTFIEIAKENNFSVDAIIKRYKRLEKQGIIRGETILVDPRRIDLNCSASLQVSVEASHVIEIINQLRKQPGVVFCTQSMGMENVFAIVVLKDLNELNALHEEIKSLKHVKDIKTSIWVDELLLCPENFELEGLKEVA